MRAAPFLFFVLVLIGCGSAKLAAKESADASYVASAPASTPQEKAAFQAGVSAADAGAFGRARGGEAAQPQLASFVPPAPRLIVRNADLTLRVKSVTEEEKAVGQLARSIGGDVEASQSTELAGPSPSMSITLRVPVTRFDETLDRLEKLGTRLSKTISSDDVTEQAVDMDARLKSLRVQEDAYRAILSAARKISDVLEVQERLTGVRTEIEQIVAQRRSLGDQAARSKIVVNLSQALQPAGPVTEPDWASQTWGEATGSVRSFGRGLAQMGIWLAAMLPVWLPILLVAIYGLRRTRRAFPS